MPFTFSHPAIVLPFYRTKKQYLSLTGLIAGSIVPDMEFLLRLKETNNFAHAWPWVLIFNLPVALVLAAIYHGMIRNALIAHSPLWMQQRLVAFCNFNWANYLKQHKQQVLISISIGIASHIFLDAITHNNGAIANMSTLFYYKIPIGQFTMPVYQVLQLLTSLLGALYIWWFIIKIKKEEGMPKLERMQGYWLYSFAIAIIVLVLRFWLGHVNHVLEDAIIAVVGSVLYGIIGVSFYYSFSKNRNRGIKKSPGI